MTIKSIAQDLGISHMTVSRALSGNPNVHAETRERIQQRAKELGYVQSAAAKAMRGDATSIVGLLLPNITNEFYARFANALAESCSNHALQLVIHLTNDDIEAESYALDRLREVHARAVVLVPSPLSNNKVSSTLSGMHVVELIRQRDEDNPRDAVLVQDRDAILKAVHHLASAGHNRIAYIGADASLSSGRGRLMAFKDGLAHSNLTEENGVILTAAPSFDMGCRFAKQVCDQDLATAIICGGFEMSNGALKTVIDENEIQAGRIQFVGYGDPIFYSWINGGVSTISVPVEALARRATDIIVQDGRTSVRQSPIVSSYDAKLITRGSARS